MIDKVRESTTLKLVLVSWAILIWAFVDASGTDKAYSLREFAESIGIILAVWLGREWRSAHYKKEVE